MPLTAKPDPQRQAKNAIEAERLSRAWCTHEGLNYDLVIQARQTPPRPKKSPHQKVQVIIDTLLEGRPWEAETYLSDDHWHEIQRWAINHYKQLVLKMSRGYQTTKIWFYLDTPPRTFGQYYDSLVFLVGADLVARETQWVQTCWDDNLPLDAAAALFLQPPKERAKTFLRRKSLSS